MAFARLFRFCLAASLLAAAAVSPAVTDASAQGLFDFLFGGLRHQRHPTPWGYGYGRPEEETLFRNRERVPVSPAAGAAMHLQRQGFLRSRGDRHRGGSHAVARRHGGDAARADGLHGDAVARRRGAQFHANRALCRTASRRAPPLGEHDGQARQLGRPTFQAGQRLRRRAIARW